MARKRSSLCYRTNMRIFVQALEQRTYLSYGAVDGSANNLAPTAPIFYRAALQPDGKVMETMGSEENFNSDFQIARLNPDGSVDTSFGSNGLVTTDLGHSDLAEGVVVQPNGKIDVAGTSTIWTTQGNNITSTASWMAVAQYNPDGSLDTTFGNGGTLLLSGTGQCIALDGDKLLVGGDSSSGTFIVRLNTDGTTDATFNASSLKGPIFPFGVSFLALDGQGRILASDFGSTKLARLNGDGALDTSFGNGGVVTIPASAGYVSNLAGLPDGSVLATSQVQAPVSDNDIDVLRFTQSGQLDPAFGTGGIADTSVTNEGALTPLPDGQILVGATDAGAAAVVRLNANGTPDDTFGYGGYFSGGNGSGVSAVVLLQNGSYLLVGVHNYRINPLLQSPAPTTMVGSAGGPYTVAEQQNIKLTASASGDAAESYEWDFNYNGVTFNPQQSGFSPTYYPGYLDGPSAHEIAVRIRNQWGSPVIATTTVNIVNGPPTAYFSPVKSTVDVGSPAIVQFTKQSDSTVDMAQGLLYSYDFNNDGVFEVTNSSSPTQLIPPSYLSAYGAFTIHGRISDAEGASTDYTTTVATITPPLSTISGALFNDTNENGVQDINEPALAGWKVYIDSNNNGVFDAGESNATTDTYGFYSVVVSPGTYNVRVVPQSGYQPVLPAGGGQTTTFASGSRSIGVNFGFYPTTLGSIAGNVFNDLNGDGTLENGEAGVAGAQVYLDANNNGALDSNEISTTTDASGNYFFANLNPGTYTVRAVTPSGWQQTSPANDVAQTVSVAPGQSVQGISFAQAQLNASITGTFFYDSNGNGIWDSGEAISPLWGVYLDLNNDGVRQASEPELIANNSGVYTFAGLLPGIYHVRPTTAQNWTQTAPVGGAQVVNAISGQTISNANFGEVRGAATITSSDIAEFAGNSFTLQLAYSGFHAVTSWTINWGDGSSSQILMGDPSSVTHTYSAPSGLSPYAITALAESSDGDAPAKPLNVMIYSMPTISGSMLMVTGSGNNDVVTFNNASGVFTVNLDGAVQHYNSSLFSSAAYVVRSSNVSITNATGENLWIDGVSRGTKMTINAMSGTINIPAYDNVLSRTPLYFSSINVAAGAKFIMNSPAPVGNVINNFRRYVAVIDPDGLNIASGGTFDLGDNDLILNYNPAEEASARNLIAGLIATGYGANKDFSGTGLTSSAANYDATQGAGVQALGWGDNADLGKTVFSDVIPLSTTNEILVKFTYYGDSNLDGIVDTGGDLALYAKGLHGQGGGWDFGDYNYDGATNNVDLSLFARGLNNGYRTYGAM